MRQKGSSIVFSVGMGQGALGGKTGSKWGGEAALWRPCCGAVEVLLRRSVCRPSQSTMVTLLHNNNYLCFHMIHADPAW